MISMIDMDGWWCLTRRITGRYGRKGRDGCKTRREERKEETDKERCGLLFFSLKDGMNEGLYGMYGDDYDNNGIEPGWLVSGFMYHMLAMISIWREGLDYR